MDELKTPKDNFKNAICYIPFVALVLHFTLNEKTLILERNIRYGISFLLSYILVTIIFGIILFFINIQFIWSLFYIVFSFIYGFKAYNGEDIRIEFFDKIYEKMKSKQN